MTWALRRAAGAASTAVLGIITLVLLVHLLPGDPLAAIIGDRALDPASEAALRQRWGIDRSLPAALGDFLTGALRGDLGMSLVEQRPVTTILAERLGPTMLLGGLTLLVNFTLGLALGLWGALRPRSIGARITATVSLACYAVPSFVIALLLIWAFAIVWPVFPAAGIADPLIGADAPITTFLADRISHLILPLATMVLATIAVPLRQQRSAALETSRATWVVAAEARGTGRARVVLQHVWRPALTPIVTLFGLWLPILVSGAVFVEAVFAWPGVGSLLASATAARDVDVVIGAGALIIIMVQAGSLAADLIYRVVDPEQRDQ